MPLTIDANFPGGNITVDRINGDTVELHPDLRDTEGGWFYWCFRVRGAAGRRLTFRFTAQDPIGARGPAVSFDGGGRWRWLGLESPDHSVFTYAFAEDADEVRFGMGMTYTQANLDAFLASTGAGARRCVLWRSRMHRPVDVLQIGNDAHPRFRVLLTARHHACEMMANYELEGIIQGMLAENETGRWLREHAECIAVPFVDYDGVEDGDQGKNRRPRDHNRDYSGAAVHAETEAIRRIIPDWLDGVPFVMLDLHCPWIRDNINETIYQVGQAEPAMWVQQQRFGQILERVHQGSLPYRQANDLPFGQSWNTAANTTTGQTSTSWAASLPKALLASSVELPYANASGQEVNAATAREFGRSIAAALQEFLAS